MALDGATEPISQQRPGVLNLVVTNNLDVDVDVTAKPQAAAGGLIVGSIGQWTISRHSVSARPIDLTTGFRVTPGSQSVVLDVDARWTHDGQTDNRHFALTKSVTVGVFFESEILKALSVPSFLALPGCLFLFTLQFLLSSGLLGVKNQSNIPSLPVTSPGFWVISLSLSALFVLLYYAFTGVNCLLTYGIGDVGIIWISSILTGLATFVTYALLRRRSIRDHVITTSDTPKDLLTKICRNHLSLLRPGVEFKLNGVEVSGLVVETMAEGTTWHGSLPTFKSNGSLVRRGSSKRPRRILKRNSTELSMGIAIRRNWSRCLTRLVFLRSSGSNQLRCFPDRII